MKRAIGTHAPREESVTRCVTPTVSAYQTPYAAERQPVLIRIFSCVILFASLAATASSCPCDGVKDPVKVTVVVILASEEGSTIDPRLKAIAQEVQKLHPMLKSFTLKHMESKSLKPGEKVSMPLVENRKLDMVVKHGADKDNRISLAIHIPNVMGEIEYQTTCGKFLPVVTRSKTKAGERLILAIRVQPCRGD